MHRKNPVEKQDYTLKVGAQGESRLRLLNELHNPHSLAFINSVTTLKNKRILDVGCGVGILSCELAKQSLPNGEVYATDISPEQLALAKENAQQSQLTNMQFVPISAFDLHQLPGKFDIIYIRFVLAHLPNTLLLIQALLSLMHPESILICEEPENTEVGFSDPADPSFDWWKEAVQIQKQHCKGDFTVGPKLADLFKQQNANVIANQVILPEMTTPRLKQQLWQGIIEISSLLISSGFTTETEIKIMIEKLKQFATHSTARIGLFSVRQIAVQKPDTDIQVTLKPSRT